MKFEDRLRSARERIDAQLDEHFADYPQSRLLKAMKYSLEGGKRVRGFLVIESAGLFGFGAKGPLRAAAAIECLHAYSLAHDDLPCMDDDDTRRGRPSLHIAFGETMAVLAGDALQSLAFEIIAGEETSADPRIRAELAFGLASAAGAGGMALGQNLDLEAGKGRDALTVDQILFLQSKKTGALLSWSAQAGAILAGRDPAPLKAYADSIGLAYQISDDLLDADQKESEGANLLNALGTDEARRMAETQIERACAALEPYGDRAETLRELARFALERDH